MFVALYKIFVNEEDPFDGSGNDDLSMDPLTDHIRQFKTSRHSSVHISVVSETPDHGWGHRTYEELPAELEGALQHTSHPERHESRAFIRLKE